MLRSTGKQGVEEVITYLDKVGFFAAPASIGHHLNYDGGLVEHSINVCNMALALRKNVVEMNPEMEAKLPEKSIILVALLHDVCKANFYKTDFRNQKNSAGQKDGQNPCAGRKRKTRHQTDQPHTA